MANMNHNDYLSVKHFPSLTEESPINTELLEEENINLPEAMENLERQIIIKALEKTGKNKAHAAKMLGIHCSALYRKLSKYDLD
jgi:DNA-binding NtrC family response regulator